MAFRIDQVTSAALLAFALATGLPSPAFAQDDDDPPARVARLSSLAGPVSLAPAGDDEWLQAERNRPLVTGDRLWTDHDARAELELGSATLRAGASTSVNLLNLDDRTAQFELAQGTLEVHVRRIAADEVVEIDTPNLALVITRPGDYRLDVDPDGEATAVAVRTGVGEIYGDGASYVVNSGQWLRFRGTDLRERQYAELPPPDAFDQWVAERERVYDRSLAARYVAPDVIGYADLDAYGSWQTVPDYGNVWFPTRVADTWAPYRDGHWAWIAPWGWTWVDDAPWGFAPFHYGRWAYVTNRWCWVPGPRSVRPVYAPALVSFVAGDGLRMSFSAGRSAPGVGWFPLGPGDLYRPSYRVSRNYFTQVNVSNTRISNAIIANHYNNPNAGDIHYMHRERERAITAVPGAVFAGGQPVGRVAQPVSPAAAIGLKPLAVAPLAPQPTAVRGAMSPVSIKPPVSALSRPVLASRAPPPAAATFVPLGSEGHVPAAAIGVPRVGSVDKPPASRVRVVQGNQPAQGVRAVPGRAANPAPPSAAPGGFREAASGSSSGGVAPAIITKPAQRGGPQGPQGGAPATERRIAPAEPNVGKDVQIAPIERERRALQPPLQGHPPAIKAPTEAYPENRTLQPGPETQRRPLVTPVPRPIEPTVQPRMQAVPKPEPRGTPMPPTMEPRPMPTPQGRVIERTEPRLQQPPPQVQQVQPPPQVQQAPASARPPARPEARADKPMPERRREE